MIKQLLKIFSRKYFLVFFCGMLMMQVRGWGQNVTLTATAGVASGSFTTLKLAFDAINLGTHQGDIVISINANTTEGTTPATLNSTGAGSASYTSVLIRPTADGLSISGNPASGFGVVQLKGADNVTIDGDNPNTGGTNRNLTIQNTATSTTTFTSVIRIATVNVANALSANNITIKNCVLTGSASGRNASGNTSTTASENNTFGIYVGGNGGTNATNAFTALSSVTTQTVPASTTVNTLLIDNNAVNSVARAIVFNGSSSASSTGVTISNNAIGNAVTLTGSLPYTTPTTSVYTKGIWINGTNAVTISGNTIRNIISYVATTISAIEFAGAIGSGTLNVSNNTIDGVIKNNTNENKFGAVLITSAGGAFTISGNNISNVEGYDTTLGSSGGVGIDVNTSATSAIISSNIINKVYNRGSTGYTARGIVINGGNNVTIQNNVVTDINNIGDLSFSTTYGVFGILVGAGTGHKVYHNSVNIFGANLGTSNNLSACLGIAGTGQTGLDIRNNIFSNTMTTSNTSSASVCLFLPSGGSSTMNLLLNNNAYYTGSTAGLHGICHVGTTYGTANLYTPANFVAGATTPSTNLRAYTSTLSAAGTNDNASYASTNTAPYTSNTNLSLNTSSSEITQVENKGATGTGVGTDILGNTRPNTGTTNPDMGAYEIAIIPLLSIADNGTQPTAGNVNQGSTNNILQTFTITEGNMANATLNTVTIPTGGNYVAGDIQASGFKLWRSTTNSFASATAFTGVTATASGSGETISFSSLSFGITKNTTVYFWVTADISATGTNGNTINANALAPANFTFAVGTPTGSVSAGGAQTILAATPTISLASGTAPVSNPTQNTTNVVLYRVDITVATTTAVLNAIQFTTGGTYIASDLTNLKIWYHTNPDFTTGTPVQIGTTKTTGLDAGAQNFTGLTQNYAVGTNYIFLTADLPCTATAGNTISVNAVANVDVTFATGSFGANTTTGSGTVTFNAVTVNNATALTTTTGNAQVSLAWTAPTGCASEVMIVVAPATNTGTPTGDGTAYTANLAYNSGTALGNGFVVYKGNTSPQVVTGLTNLTTYYFKIFTRSGTNWSSGIEIDAMPNAYCTASLHTGSTNHITNVSITGTTLNSSNGLGAGGYTVVPNTPSSNVASLRQGTSYTATLTIPSCTPTQTALWVDFDRNGTFNTSEYFVVTCSVGTGTATINVPLGASLGTTKMRVRSRGAAFANTDACTSFPSGETEDYFITILPPLPRTLGTIATSQATPANINKNTTNNPIVRIDLPVTEALGTLTLTNLVVTSANTNDADVASNGVKLYYTTTTTFSTATPVGTGQSFASGTATFSGLTQALATGNNYIWVAYDVATTATVGNTLDAQIGIGNMTIVEAGGANATGSIPVSTLNPTGSILIIPRTPLALTATAFSNTQINLSNTANADGDNIMVAWNSTNTFGTPTGTYTAGNSIVGGGTVLYVGTAAGLTNHTGLTANTQYFYSVWTVGGTAYSSTAQTANATTLPNPLNYVFSQSNGTYGEITPTTTLFTGASIDNNVSASQTITSFIYNGVAYTNMFVSANGFVKLGAATGPGGTVYTPLSTTSTALQNTISAFSADLGGVDATSSVGWSTVGNEIIVQWKNMRRYLVTGESVNFQIRMNTVTGVINIVYGTFVSGTSANTLQVGIRGFDETWRTQVSNRQGNLEWDKTTMGTNNTSALPMTTTNLPTSGLTFTYTPNTCTPFPIIGAVTQTGTNVTVNWTAQAEATDGYDVRYRLQSAGIGTYTVVNVAGQASNNTVIAGLSAGTYVFEVRSRCSGTTFSDYSNAVVFNVLGNYYLKAGGVMNTLTDWGTNTDGTGTNPSALNEANAIWNIRNNVTVTNPATWTLGTASKIIVGDGTNSTNFILPSGANVTGTIDVANLGTLTLQNTTNPTLGTLAVGSTVDYAGTGAQTIAVANYSNLTISGARTGSPAITLASGTIGISNNFTITATGVGSYTNTGNTIDFSGAGMQTIPAFTYRNITNTGNGNRTLASSGEVNIAGTFSLGTGAYTVTGSTVNYSATSGGGFVMASFNYNNLIFSGTQTYSIGTGNTMNVAGNFTWSSTGTFNVSNSAGTTTLAVVGDATITNGTFNVANSSGTGLFSVGNDLNISGGVLRVISNSSAPSTTLNITRDFIISGAGRILLESIGASAGRTAIVNVGRDFTSTGTSTSIVDFGSLSVAVDNNAVNIARNFSHSGSGNFTTGSSGAPSGFVFNAGGVLQTFSYTGVASSQFVPYVIGNNSNVQMLSNLALPLGTNPRSNFTVNAGATLDMGTRVISTTNATDAIFTLSSGATIKTSHASGLTSNFSGFTAGTTLLLNSGANYEFNGTAAQVTSAFVTTPTANTVNNLTINNTTSTSSTGVTLSSNLTVNGVLNLTQGKLTTGSNTLTIQAGASAVSPALGKANSYVVGNVSITSNTDGQTLLFPMGAGTWWGPARLVTNGGTANATNFSVTYYNVPSVLNSAPLPTTPEIITNALHVYWDINKVSGGRNADVQLYWNGNLGQITDRTKLRVLHGNGAVWENYGVDNTNGSAADGTLGSNVQGSIIKNAVSIFSPFTIGSTDSSNPLPLNLISFNPTRIDEEKVNLMWQTANEVDLKHFVIEKSKDAINFVIITNVDAQNSTPQIKNYEFVDNENESAYYRLRFVHFNSPDEFSPIKYVKGNQKQDFIIVYPNPLKDDIAFKVSENLKQNKDISLQVIDNQGKNIASFVGDWQTISQQVSAVHPNWQNGVYTWIISPKGEKKQILKVVKL